MSKLRLRDCFDDRIAFHFNHPLRRLYVTIEEVGRFDETTRCEVSLTPIQALEIAAYLVEHTLEALR